MNQHQSEFHDLIEQLQAERPSVLEPNRHFTNQLRSRLLATYDKKPGWELGRLTSTATALALLALVIFGGWYIASSQQPTMIAGEAVQTTRIAEVAESVNQLEVIHSILRVSRVMNKNYTWQATIEHWQTADGQYSRTMITEESGKLLHFAQSNGQYLWQDVGINPITSPNRRVLDFSQEELDSLSASSEEAASFYGEVGWDSLAGALVATDWNCQTDQCVYEKLAEPPALGIEPGAFASGQYGGGISLIGTEEINGRTVNIFEFRYKAPETAAGDTLPQYRIAKVDSETFRVVSLTDYDGEQVMRSIELINREPITMAPQDFQGITSDAFAAMAVEPRETIPFENGLQIAGYVLLPDSADQDNLQFTVFWQAEEEVEDDIFRGIIHVVDENGALVTEANGPLRWQTDNGDIMAQMSFRDIEQWPNGRYQIYGGVYDQAVGRNLLSDSGTEMVLLDTIVLEESAAAMVDMDGAQIPFGDNVALTYSHVIQAATTSRDETHILRFLWYARQRPTENLVAFVHLLDENGQVVQQQDQELVWTVAAGEMVKPDFIEYALQSVEVAVPDGRYQVQVGLYDGSTGQRVTTTEATVQGETAVLVDTIILGDSAEEAQGSIWPVSLSQAARNLVSENVNIEMVIGYDLSNLSEGDYVLKLHYAAPDWQQVTAGRSPVDGMSDYLTLTGQQGELRINFSGNPQEMQSIAGTANPVPVIILGQFHELVGGGRQFEALATVTSDEFPLLLDSTEATTYRVVEEETQN